MILWRGGFVRSGAGGEGGRLRNHGRGGLSRLLIVYVLHTCLHATCIATLRLISCDKMGVYPGTEHPLCEAHMHMLDAEKKVGRPGLTIWYVQPGSNESEYTTQQSTNTTCDFHISTPRIF